MQKQSAGLHSGVGMQPDRRTGTLDALWRCRHRVTAATLERMGRAESGSGREQSLSNGDFWGRQRTYPRDPQGGAASESCGKPKSRQPGDVPFSLWTLAGTARDFF